MKRGRPRHDDVLTPREWQVLDLIRQGLTNESISQQLGISLDTAKFHVSEILAKLGVATRQEAARWEGKPKRRWAWIPNLVGVPLWALVSASLVLFVLVAGVVVLFGQPSGKKDSLEAPVPSGVDEAAEQLQLVVCYDDDTWKRPSLEGQAAHVDADPRFPPFRGNYESQFAADFWAPPLGASPVGTVIEFSGLWTLGSDPELVPAFSRTCPVAGSNAGLDAVYLWLFGFDAHSVMWAQDQMSVSVTPKPAGFQIVQVKLPGPIAAYGRPIAFVGPGGVVGRIDMRAIWSGPP